MEAIPMGEPTGEASGLRILIVDDNVDCVETTATLLTLYGHAVHKATSGGDAVTALTDRQFDVVLLDISLPGMTGHDLARWIRSQTLVRRPVLIALTGHGDEANRQRSAECGIEHHLLKPVDPHYLKDLLVQIAG
jgi:CheY-like chemotaxis protein